MNMDEFENLGGTDETPFQKYKRIALYQMSTKNFWIIAGSTWSCFTITLIWFSFGLLRMPLGCYVWDVIVVFAVIIGIAYHYLAARGGLILPVSLGCLLAVVVGTVLGMYNYDTFAIFPMFYDNARKYTNVVASEPAAAVADAGKLTFNTNTKVDLDKAVGYVAESGTIYCVAPVVDPVKQPRIEFWAAGINCCSAVGNFNCDAARDKTAGGGVVVFNNNGWFAPSRFPFYQKAQQKAEAQFMLQSVGNPLYVRWVERDNLDYLHNYYGTRSTIFITVSVLIAAVLSALIAFAMWEPRK